MGKKNTISDEGDPRKYFAMIPHLIDDSELDPYAYRLYGHLVRLAKQGHEIEQTTRELATHCRMSVGKVSDAKLVLAKKNLIAIESDGYRDRITIKDIWRENMLRYANIGAPSGPPLGADPPPEPLTGLAATWAIALTELAPVLNGTGQWLQVR